MIRIIRKYLFLVFNKVIPIHLIEEAIKKNRIKFYSDYCTRGEHSILHADARILNFQNKPENIRIGKNSLIRGELLINAYGGKIMIGDNTSVGEHSRIWSSEQITIGDNVQISHSVNIMDGNTHSLNHEERQQEYLEILKCGNIKNKGNISSAPIVIEDHVWISFNVTILKGVRIGKGAIVAANTLVTKDVAPFTMVAGNPAKALKILT